MLCGAPCSGGWGGSQIKVCSSAAQTARKLLQNALESFGVYLVVREGKNPTQAVLGAHVAFDHRRAAAQHHDRDGLEVKSRFHGCGKKALRANSPLLPDDAPCILVHAAGLSGQNTLYLRVGDGQSDVPADLLFCFIHAADHAEFQTAACGCVGNAVVQPHEIHRPAADVHRKDRRLVLDEFGV